MKFLKLAEVPEIAPVCAQWLFNEWGYRKPGSTLEQSMQRFLQRINIDTLPVAFVAISDNEAAGTASLVETEDDMTAMTPWLSGVFVPEAMRGQGIATGLIARVESEARRLGFPCIWLSASVPEMYQKLGYQFTGADKQGEPIMVKRL